MQYLNKLKEICDAEMVPGFRTTLSMGHGRVVAVVVHGPTGDQAMTQFDSDLEYVLEEDARVHVSEILEIAQLGLAILTITRTRPHGGYDYMPTEMYLPVTPIA